MSHQEVIQAEIVQWLKENQSLVRSGAMPKANAILSDPPYNFSFMNKIWDSHATPQHFQSWVTEWATLLLDFVHPGAVLAMAGGTRTYHRLASGLEDAGWELFDCLFCWNHGEGFPKSLSISKAIDKAAGAEREVVGEGKYSKRRPNDRNNEEALYGTYSADPESTLITTPATPDAQRFNGYGTALKPSVEPFVLARAPRGKLTFTELALQYGTGALNIDGCRVVTQDGRSNESVLRDDNQVFGKGLGGGTQEEPDGRYPANTILVCACEGDQHEPNCPVAVMDSQSGESKSKQADRGRGIDGNTFKYGGGQEHDDVRGFNDEGGASRFLYRAKASAWEREAGLGGDGDGNSRRNTNPAIKPIRLCEYIARMLLPPPLDVPRRILVPFAGSGSEMIGAHLAGWDEIVGIEREAEYVAINNARRQWWSGFSSYDDAEKSYKAEHKQTKFEQADRDNKATGVQLELF